MTGSEWMSGRVKAKRTSGRPGNGNKVPGHNL